VLVNTFFEKRVEQLFDMSKRLAEALSRAGIAYRIVGGLAAYLHVEAADPGAGRLTRDVDAAVERRDLASIVAAAEPFGFVFRYVAGVDMLVDTKEPNVRRAVHFVFVGEKVRPEYSEPVPEFTAPARFGELLVAPVADLVRMKLTSFRDKDRVHLRDLDDAGLITPEVEATLPALLRERLAHVRATE
jgi:hypothetical protein